MFSKFREIGRMFRPLVKEYPSGKVKIRLPDGISCTAEVGIEEFKDRMDYALWNDAVMLVNYPKGVFLLNPWQIIYVEEVDTELVP